MCSTSRGIPGLVHTVHIVRETLALMQVQQKKKALGGRCARAKATLKNTGLPYEGPRTALSFPASTVFHQ